MTSIDFYYDFRSPFAYFATCRMGLLTDKGAEINWRPVFVDVLLNCQVGKAPWDAREDPFCPPKRAHFMADIFRLIEYWQIPFNMPSPQTPSANTAMAIAALLARDGTTHTAFHDAMFKAIWQEQKDGADPQIIGAALAAGGHDEALIDRAEEGVDLLTKNTLATYESGIFGTPTFVIGDDLYFGADRMELVASKL